jgi:TatD DNase family protein
MLIDTHCHINMMVKSTFDVPLQPMEINQAQEIVDKAKDHHVTRIINVGTSLIESNNCIELAKKYPAIFATIGIHPNDLTASWKEDFKQLQNLMKQKEINRIVGVGETGLDRHYPDTNLPRQKDAFKAHIELALEYDVGLVVHTRDARDETLRSLEEYKGQIKKGIIHCFSEDQAFANQVIEWDFKIGIGGTITYPKNLYLRDIVSDVSLDNMVLETDAPFLPPQIIRGKQNHPLYIETIARYIAELRGESFDLISQVTTKNAIFVFNLDHAI